ncbi:hypothetical protein LQL77_29880, partial [Rhodococcus cerastii]|nr:hypothetical protein [Rhodococcus cerastii]
DTPTDNGYTAVAAGHAHSVALKGDGTLVSWGDDHYQEVTDTPTDNGYTAVSAGGDYSVALKSVPLTALPFTDQPRP